MKNVECRITVKRIGKVLCAVLLIVHSTFCNLHSASAQDLKYYQYDTDLLSKQFHQGRRDSLRSKMPDNSAAVLFANPEHKRSNDMDYVYHQDPNFYYLTGFTEPNSVLVI